MPQVNFNTIRQTPEGELLCQYLAQQVLSLDTTKGVDCTDKERATIEVRARQLAQEKLSHILADLLTEEFRGTIKDDKDDYSIT